MDITSIATSAAKNFTGASIEHALIGFPKLSEVTEDNQKKAASTEQKRLDSIADAMKKRGRNSLGSGGSDIASSLKQMVFLPVDYNPATLNLTAVNGQQQKSGVEVLSVNYPAATTLSCDVWFDRMNTRDAFMWDAVDSGLSATAGIKTLAGVDKDKSVSVQSCVEGMAAALMKPETRNVVFVWGKTIFVGELCKVKGKYTMFNPQGDPVRAKVTISIRDQVDETSKQYWERATKDFQSIMKKNGRGSGTGSANSPQTVLGSLLNI